MRSIECGLVSILAEHQVSGVRFIHNCLAQYSGVILNDESGLGKCHQVVAFLSAALAANAHERCLIVCSDQERILHWTYHLELLAPELRSKVNISTTADELSVERDGWTYLVVDVRRDGKSKTHGMTEFERFDATKHIFVVSHDLLEDGATLQRALHYCCGGRASALCDLISKYKKQPSKSTRFQLFLGTRCYLLRRHAQKYKEILPLVVRETFVNKFNEWLVSRGQRSAVIDTMSCETVECSPFGFAVPAREDNGPAVEAPSLTQQRSEPLFDPVEFDTEQMPRLRVEPDTPDTEPLVIPETELMPQSDSEGYVEFGQALSHIIPSTQAELAEEHYRFPIEKFLGSISSSSVDAEPSTDKRSTPVLISSSNSTNREKSPDLFGDSDGDDFDGNDTRGMADDSLLALLSKSPAEASKPKPTKTRRHLQPSFSTPMSKLIFGDAGSSTATKQQTSCVDLFADTTIKEPDNVFEITENNAFPNRIRVHEAKATMSPLRAYESSDGDVEIVAIERPPRLPDGEVIDVDESCSPKSPMLHGAGLKTPTSRGSIGCTAGHGWLKKSAGRHSSTSPGQSKSTPTGSKRSPADASNRTRSGGSASKRRRKLENWFHDDSDHSNDTACASTSAKRLTDGRRMSPKKKCFQERLVHNYNRILVSSGDGDSD